MKASTLWNYNELNSWEHYVFSCMNKIEGLLEDEQGLSMWEMLTVKFRQSIHEFTFGVGMNFISYPLVLTPLV
jgi:hypothetical protein